MNRAFIVALVSSLLFCAQAGAQGRVVLVASAESPLETLSSVEIRKLYLGVSVFKDGRSVQPIRNTSDERLDNVLLQSVVGLSADRYERRLITNRFKFATAPPAAFSDLESLLKALGENLYSVSYVWVTDELPDGLKELRVLWREF